MWSCPNCQARFSLQMHPPITAGGFDAPVFRDVVALVLASKRKANRDADYVKSLEHYLTTFIAGWESRPVEAATFEEVENRLAELAGKQSDSSRQTWFTRTNTLFSFAKRRGIIAENPFARLERITVDRKTPEILTPEQAEKLVRLCPPIMVPYLALTLFSGVRPCGEAMKIRWEHINLESGTVEINFPKVRKHRRIVTLEPIALDLLRSHWRATGLVSPSKSTVRRWKRKMRTALGLVKWTADLLRHTAASFLYQLKGDAAAVAKSLGNSVAVMMTHYIVPVTAKACALFWAIVTPWRANEQKRAVESRAVLLSVFHRASGFLRSLLPDRLAADSVPA